MRKTFIFADTYQITADVVCEGPLAVVFGSDTYREIWLKNENGFLTTPHSHGYLGDGWMPYFQAVCGVAQ